MTRKDDDTAVTASVAASVSDIAAGSSIGPYRLIRQLGEGGMGVVYHAQQVQPLRREVALKVIKPGMDSRQVIARFESERQALALMDHPHIARVFDAGTTSEGRPYFAMELVDGVPITRFCDTKRMTVDERIQLFIPVCQAIQHAHQKGIIHRDIKPSNLLVTDRDGRPIGKVIDFGLAKALGHQLSDASMMTNVGMVVGTLEYMSPEQADLTRQDIDTRSDVYSLGAVLYELLTGTTPLGVAKVEAAGYVEALRRIREEEPKQLLHGELDWIVMKALEKDRTRRYETVNALARDLERYLAGDAVEAGPPSTTYRLKKFASRHRVGLAMAGTVAALLVAGVVVSTWMAVRASRAEAEARAVNDFLQNDVLAQATADTQARPDTKPDQHLEVRTALDRAAARVESKFSTQPLVEASIQRTIGEAYRRLGVYPQAQQHLERALALRRRVLGEQHVDTLDVMNDVQRLYWQQGKYAQAEALGPKLLDLGARVRGKDDPQTLESMITLALVYRNQGKYPQAEALLKEAAESGRRVLGEEHVATIEATADLALVYSDQGKQTQAEPLFSRVLDVWRRVGGEEHPETLQCMNNLALCYARQGKYAQAEPLFMKTLEIRRRVLGSDHQETMRSIHNLAALYNLEARYAGAEPLFAEALQRRTTVLGSEHPDTLVSTHALAGLYLREDKPRLAQDLYVKVVEARRRILGSEHPDTLASELGLGETLVRLRDYAGAEHVLRDALEGFEKSTSDSVSRYSCQSLLGASLAGQRKFVEAESLLVSGFEGMSKRNAARTSLADAADRLVFLYQAWGKPEKAAEWRGKK